MRAQSWPAVSDDDILREYATRWAFLARPGQVPPRDREWFVYLMRSGRGGGKTRAGAEWVLQRVRDGYRTIALVGQTAADVRDTMIELGESSIMKVARPHERPTYEPSKRRLTFPNGAVAVAYTGDEPDQLRGPQHDSAWVDELAKFRYPQECWDNLIFGLRLGKCPQVFVTTTPRPTPIIRQLLAAGDTIDVRFSTYDNAENLSPVFLAKIRERYEGTRLGRQELYGEVLTDTPGALWTRDLIETTRVSRPPQLTRVVVGVDPAVTSGADSDETGIIVAGKGADGHGYILDDRSVHGSPYAWARRAVDAYHDYQADRIVAESNNGGELVEVNIRVADPAVSYKSVNASRGKQTRAEPISALFEQSRAHIVGGLPELEDQMCDWVPGEKSPDRMDAMVWAMTELMLGGADGSRFRRVASR